jgi:hypothetical protein
MELFGLRKLFTHDQERAAVHSSCAEAAVLVGGRDLQAGHDRQVEIERGEGEPGLGQH